MEPISDSNEMTENMVQEDSASAPIAVGKVDATHDATSDNDEPPALIPLTDEDKQIIETIENIIAPTVKAKPKAKAKAKTVDVENNSKIPTPKQVTLLLNQILQIKLPEGDKACKIEFI